MVKRPSTYRAIIEMKGKSKEFRAGFMAALEFLDGADPMQIFTIYGNRAFAHIGFTGVDDDSTYRIKNNRVVYESPGAVI